MEGLSRKLPSHYKSHLRRRLPKRYSDLISPTSTKIFLSRKDSFARDRPSAHILRRHSLKPIHETIDSFNPSRRKSREIFDYRQHQLVKQNDHLAQRMQAVLSSELMNSFDRNFLVNRRKPCVPRSHSFNVTMRKQHRRVERKFSYHFLPRVKMNFEKRNIFFEEPTPDYVEAVEEIPISNNTELDDEPTVDYEDAKTLLTAAESEDKTMTTPSDQGASSSFIVPQINTADEEEFIPSIPTPPLLNLNTAPKPRGFRCRTIADKLSSDHKLILKDYEDVQEEQKSSSPLGDYP